MTPKPLNHKKYPKDPLAHGGVYRNTRAGRGRRPLSTGQSTHLVLRSSKATGTRSFRHRQNKAKVHQLLHKFAAKNGIKIFSYANVGNHLHIHLKLSRRPGYEPFIRAVTAAIAMAVAGKSRWNKVKEKFWDYRPFTRVVLKSTELRLRDYIEINKLEGEGIPRSRAKQALGWRTYHRTVQRV